MPVRHRPVRVPFRWSLVLLLLVGATSALAPAAPTGAQPASGVLTVLHASHSTGPVAVFVDGRLVDGSLAYGMMTQTDAPPEGSVRLVLAAADDHARVLLDRAVELARGGSTLAVAGPDGRVAVIDTGPLGVEAGRSRTTFLSAERGGDTVLLANAAGGLLASSADFLPGVSVTVDAVPLRLEAARSSDGVILARAALDPEPSRGYAIVLVPAATEGEPSVLAIVAGQRGRATAGAGAAAAPGSVLVREDFSDPAAGVLPVAPPAGSILQYGYSAGEYLLRNSGVETRSVALPGDYSDATIAVDARLVGDVDGRTVSVGCRFRSDSGGNYGYRLRVEPGTALFRLVREDGARDTLLVANRRSTAINRGLAVNRLELTCSGPTITGSINGVQVVSLRDSTYATGPLTLGVGARAAGLTSEARFDNLIVTQR